MLKKKAIKKMASRSFKRVGSRFACRLTTKFTNSKLKINLILCQIYFALKAVHFKYKEKFY